ncbi:MAG TPA: acyl-CoA dehydrogenase family protein [Sphingomonadales bacterium]
MDFQLTENQRQLQEAARRYADAVMPEVAARCERTSEPPSIEVRRDLARMGFLGVNISEEYGGLGLGNLEAIIVLEQFARHSAAAAFPVFESCVGPVKAIEHFAPESLRRKVLPRVCAGEIQVAICMSEPDAGTALTDLKTRAVKDGAGYVLNGRKRWTSGGGHADGYVVYCRMSDDPGAKGIGAVYVEKGQPGLSFGKQEEMMGWHGVGHCDIYFDDVRVPEEHVIVPAGGFRKLMEAFDLERCGNATMSLGLAVGALEQATAYVQERQQFGKPIVDFQAVQIRLAEMAMQVEAARLLIYRAVQNASMGMPSVFESSVAKCFANEIVRSVCLNGVQLMGGYGFAREYGMEQRLRDSFGWGIAGGTIDVQKTNIAAAMVGRRFNQRA